MENVSAFGNKSLWLSELTGGKVKERLGRGGQQEPARLSKARTHAIAAQQ